MTHLPSIYTYSLQSDGCDDLWSIYAPGEDQPFASIPFWDEPDTNWRAEAETKVRCIVTMLNACQSITHEALEQDKVIELFNTLEHFIKVMHDYQGSDESDALQIAPQ